MNTLRRWPAHTPRVTAVTAIKGANNRTQTLSPTKLFSWNGFGKICESPPLRSFNSGSHRRVWP